MEWLQRWNIETIIVEWEAHLLCTWEMLSSNLGLEISYPACWTRVRLSDFVLQPVVPAPEDRWVCTMRVAKRFWNTFYTSIKIKRKCVQFFLWLIETLSVLQSKSRGNMCCFCCGWFWISCLLLSTTEHGLSSKPWSVLGEFSLAEMLLKSSFNTTVHDHMQAWKHWKQLRNSDGLFFTTHLTTQILLPQISTSLEPSKMPSMGKGLGVMMRGYWRSGCG